MEGDRLKVDQAIGYPGKEGQKSKDESLLRVLSHDETLSSVKDLIYNIKGKVLPTEHAQDTGGTSFLNAEIPSGQYGFFLEKLRQLGTLQSPTPVIDTKGSGYIKIRIHFLPS